MLLTADPGEEDCVSAIDAFFILFRHLTFLSGSGIDKFSEILPFKKENRRYVLYVRAPFSESCSASLTLKHLNVEIM